MVAVEAMAGDPHPRIVKVIMVGPRMTGVHRRRIIDVADDPEAEADPTLPVSKRLHQYLVGV